MSLATLAASMNGIHRSGPEHFDTERAALERMAEMKAAGGRNVRKSRWHDFTRRDGTKVYKWTVTQEIAK